MSDSTALPVRSDHENPISGRQRLVKDPESGSVNPVIVGKDDIK